MNASTGQQFELEVYDILKRTLEVGMLGLVPAHTQIYHQKQYYSDLRKSFIKVDVSLEVTLPGADTPFFVWIWECKDYSHKVPVDDVEEFDSKLQQIGADNTKGTIITRVGFQRSVIEYAKSRKIGLARLTSSNRLWHVLSSYTNPIGPLLESVETDAIALMTKDLDAADRHPGSTFGGLDLQGNYVARTNVFGYISRQLFVSIPRETGHTCCCCGDTPVHAFMDVKYTAKAGTQEGESAEVWTSHALCQTCSRLLKYTPDTLGNVAGQALLLTWYMAMVSGVVSVFLSYRAGITIGAVFLVLYIASQFLFSCMTARRMERYLGLSRAIFRKNVCISLLTLLRGRHPNLYHFSGVKFRSVENPPAF